MAEQNLKTKALNGVKWTSIERFLMQIFQFVFGILIARRVDPADYGLIGMLTIFIMLSQSIIDNGFGLALIRKKEKTAVDYSTVFYFNISLGVVIYLILFLAAPAIAHFYNIPKLGEIVRVYGIVLLFSSFSIVVSAKLTSEFQFKRLFFAHFIALIAAGTTGLYTAHADYGVWALVAYNCTFSFMQMTLLWLFARWLPLLQFSISSFKKFFSFGWKILVSGLIDIIHGNIYELTIGKFYYAHDVGIYTRSRQFVTMTQGSILSIIEKVALPTLSPLQDDNEKLLYAYDKIFRLSIYVIFPFLTGLAILAGPIIDVLLGSKWLACVPFLQILAIGALWEPLARLNLNLLLTKGRSDILLKINIIKKIIGFSIVALTVPFGMYWICIGLIFYYLCAFVINSIQTKKILGYGLVQQVKAVIPALMKTIIMATVVFATTFYISSSILKLIIGFIIGVACYILLGVITKDTSFLEVKSIVLKAAGFRKKTDS